MLVMIAAGLGLLAWGVSAGKAGRAVAGALLLAATVAFFSEERPFDRLAGEANQAFDDYLQALADERFGDAGDALEKLSQSLDRLAGQAQE